MDGEAAGEGDVDALGLAAGEAEAVGEADARGLAAVDADGDPDAAGEADGDAEGDPAGEAVFVTPVTVAIDVAAASGNDDVSIRRTARSSVSFSVSWIVLQCPFSQNCRVGPSPVT